MTLPTRLKKLKAKLALLEAEFAAPGGGVLAEQVSELRAKIEGIRASLPLINKDTATHLVGAASHVQIDGDFVANNARIVPAQDVRELAALDTFEAILLYNSKIVHLETDRDADGIQTDFFFRQADFCRGRIIGKHSLLVIDTDGIERSLVFFMAAPVNLTKRIRFRRQAKFVGGPPKTPSAVAPKPVS